MCVLSIKVPIQKKSGNLFNDPRTLYIYLQNMESTPMYQRKNENQFVNQNNQ